MKTTPMRTNESAAGSTRLLHRLTAALLALVLAASAALPVFAADTAPTDTIYINSVSDLLAFADKCGFDQWSKGKTVILQEDLSLEDTEWAPVASFSGAFKGNGHTISDVSLVGAYSPAGFFGILEEGGSIQDLTIKGVVNPAGTQKTAGGLVGTNYGTIINCTFSGAVHGEEEAGGLVGRNETSGTIDHSTSRAMVSGAYATGGIVGYNLGVITGCTNVGAVNSEYQESALDMEGLPATLLELVKKDMGDDLSNNISNVSSDTGGIAGRSSGLILSSANAGDVGYAHVGYNVGGIVGRTDDMLIIRGVNVFPSQIEQVVNSFDEITPHYQIVLTTKGTLDQIELRVETAPDFPFDEIRALEDLRKRLAAALKSNLQIAVKIKFCEPKTIERSEGKSKRVIDLREVKQQN